MGISSCVDQLNVHPNGVATLLYASFQNVGYAKLLCDLGQVLPCALILLRRCAGDHL